MQRGGCKHPSFLRKHVIWRLLSSMQARSSGSIRIVPSPQPSAVIRSDVDLSTLMILFVCVVARSFVRLSVCLFACSLFFCSFVSSVGSTLHMDLHASKNVCGTDKATSTCLRTGAKCWRLYGDTQHRLGACCTQYDIRPKHSRRMNLGHQTD